MTRYSDNRSTPLAITETRRQLGICPAELCILLAILSHERIHGESPTRAAIATFLKVQPKGYRLIRIGWIRSRLVALAPGKYVAIWSTTRKAKAALGFDELEERRAG